ncbi:MAG: hypothetical protein ABJZ55_12130 [Fuerstiella sp.]
MADEKLYVVKDGKKRSKSVTESAIRKLFIAGRISEDARVLQVGTTFYLPVEEFLGIEASDESEYESPKVNLSAIGRIAASEESVSTRSGPAQNPTLIITSLAICAAVGAIGYIYLRDNWDELIDPLIVQINQASSSALKYAGIALAILILLIPVTMATWALRRMRAAKFNVIPKTGVDATRDYLRSLLTWIEWILNLIHAGNFYTFYIVSAACLVKTAVLIYDTATAEWIDGPMLGMSLGWAIAWAAIPVLLFIINQFSEVGYRLMPGMIRYWIELNEEKRGFFTTVSEESID